MRAAALARAEQKRALDAYVAQMMLTEQQAREKAEAWMAERRQASNGNGALAVETTQARAWEHTLLHGTPPDEQYLLDYHARVLRALENDLAVPDS